MGDEDEAGTRRGAWYAALTVLALVAVVALALLVGGDDEDDPTASTAATSATTSTSANVAPSTTAMVVSTTVVPSTTAAPVDLSTAVWPDASGPLLTDPVEAAAAFATDFLGFTDPLVGDYQAGDSRSGEVEIRPVDDGPVTTIMVRQLGTDGAWYVLAAATGTIVVDEPSVPAIVSSPITVSGSALAFEGNVLVEVREDGSEEPLGESFVTGGGDEMRPFEGSIDFAAPTAQYGALVLYTTSAEDGQVWAASVQRIELAPTT